MYITIAIIIFILLFSIVYTNLPKFGKLPSGKRLERIKQSPYYKNGSFQNQNNTPVLTDGVTYFAAFKDFIFGQKNQVKPIDKIPSTKTNLLNLDKTKDILVWFGHSSYFMQIDGNKILIDPVLSGYASPFSFSIKAFAGADIYKTEDIPEIDYLFITHDHWDHLDYNTIMELKSKIKTIICPLGVGEHFEYWGFDKNIIKEEDWNTEILLDKGFSANTVPARHFSGRLFARNKSLWTAFVFQTPSMKIFIGGDGGYDKHFAEIGKKFGTIDLAILENGQYDKNWAYIHMNPKEVLQAAQDLNANKILPVHSSKFALSKHKWDNPLELITNYNKNININIITPIIGEEVNLNGDSQIFTKWWKNIK